MLKWSVVLVPICAPETAVQLLSPLTREDVLGRDRPEADLISSFVPCYQPIPRSRPRGHACPPLSPAASNGSMGSDWCDQISSIIADTNRNLDGRGLATIAAVPPLVYRTARPAEFESVFRGGPSATAGAFSGCSSGGSYGWFNLPESPKAAAAAAAHQAHQAHATSQAAAQQSPLDALMSDGQQANLTSQVGNFQSSLQRILESVKFELDVRGSIAQKHMEV